MGKDVLVASRLDREAIARSLGVGDEEVALRKFLADCLDSAELPSPWTEQVDDKKRVFYWNPASRTSSWTHPLDGSIRVLVATFQDAWAGDLDAVVQDELQRSQEDLEQESANWRWATSSQGVTYYYNEVTRLTRWDDPRDELMAHLNYRFAMLSLLQDPQYVSELHSLEPQRAKSPEPAPVRAPSPVREPTPEEPRQPTPVVEPTPQPLPVEPVKEVKEPEPVELDDWPVEKWMCTNEFAIYLGLRVKSEKVLIELLRPVFLLPLPSPWQAKMDKKQRVYFYHMGFVKSQWTHPCEPFLQFMIGVLRRHRPFFQEATEMERAIQTGTEESLLEVGKNFGLWSGPWLDPDYSQLFYLEQPDEEECRWDHVPMSVRAAIQWRADAWGLVWRSFFGSRPLLTKDEVDARVAQAMTAVTGGAILPSINERDIFPAVQGCLAGTYGKVLANIANDTVEQNIFLKKTNAKVNSRLEDAEAQVRAVAERRQNAKPVAVQAEPLVMDEDVQAEADRFSDGFQYSEQPVSEPPPTPIPTPLPTPPPTPVPSVTSSDGAPAEIWSDDDIWTAEAKVEVTEDEMHAEMHASGLLALDDLKGTPAVPNTAPSVEFDHVAWVQNAFVTPYLTQLQAVVMKSMRGTLSTAPLSQGDLSVWGQSHFTSPLVSLDVTPRGSEPDLTSTGGLGESRRPEMKDYFKAHFETSVVAPYMDELAASNRECDMLLNEAHDIDEMEKEIRVQEKDMKDPDEFPFDPHNIDFPGPGGVARPSSPEGGKPADYFPAYLQEKADESLLLPDPRPRAASAGYRDPFLGPDPSRISLEPDPRVPMNELRPSSATSRKQAFSEPVQPPPEAMVQETMDAFWKLCESEDVFAKLDVEKQGFVAAKKVPGRLKKMGFKGKGKLVVLELDKNRNGVFYREHFKRATVDEALPESLIAKLVAKDTADAEKRKKDLEKARGPPPEDEQKEEVDPRFAWDVKRTEHDPEHEHDVRVMVRECMAELLEEAYLESVERAVISGLGAICGAALIKGLEPPPPLPDMEFFRQYHKRREAERIKHEAEMKRLAEEKERLQGLADDRADRDERYLDTQYNERGLPTGAAPATPPYAMSESSWESVDEAVAAAERARKGLVGPYALGELADLPYPDMADLFTEKATGVFGQKKSPLLTSAEIEERIRRHENLLAKREQGANKALFQIRRTPLYRLYHHEFKALPKFAKKPPPLPGQQDQRKMAKVKLPPLRGPQAPPPPPRLDDELVMRPETPLLEETPVRREPRPKPAPPQVEVRAPYDVLERDAIAHRLAEMSPGVGSLRLAPDFGRFAVLQDLARRCEPSSTPVHALDMPLSELAGLSDMRRPIPIWRVLVEV